MSKSFYSEEKLDMMLNAVKKEVLDATSKFGPFNSPHEGYAVIQEELEELWDDIKADKGRQPDAYHEAKQVAAMGIRYMMEFG